MKQDSKSKLVRKLDGIFSQYIRLRDMIPNTHLFKCISCGKVYQIKDADCGHYINRKHMSTRFSEINCNAQCRSCNRFDEGNMSGYRNGIIHKYGEAQVIVLESMRNEIRKYSVFELSALCEHYKKEVDRLKKEKDITSLCSTK